MRGIRQLLHNHDFALLWSGQTVSTLGTSASQLAFPLLVLALTHSAADAGFVAAAQALPPLLFSLPAGALVDRWNRKRAMILCDAGRALCLGSIPAALAIGRLTIEQIYVVALLEGSLGVFFGLAEASCLPHVVVGDQLVAAVAQGEVTEGAVSLAGPSLAGVLYATGRALPFLVDALSYAASSASLVRIRAQFQEESEPSQSTLRREIAAGMAWLWRQPFLRAMTLMYGGAALVLPASGLLTIVLAERLHASATAIGLIFAGEGAGMIVGSALGAWVRLKLRVGQCVLAVRSVGVVLWLLLALAPNLQLLSVVVVVAGVSGQIEDVAYFSYRHLLIPDAFKGRVLSIIRLAPAITRPLGLALVGLLIQRLGAVQTILLTSIWLAALALGLVPSRSIRAAPKLADAVAAS